jgi:ribosomal protein S18 acetylase RimI-like enzyme
MKIRRLVPGDEGLVLAGGELFDAAPTEAWTERFLGREGHLLVAVVGEEPVGFVTGMEMTHPDKGTEMFLYELSVDTDHRNRGIGRALVGALAELARSRGCYGMWVLTDDDNAPALAAYRAAGASQPEPSVTLTWTFGTPVGE